MAIAEAVIASGNKVGQISKQRL